VRTWLLIRERLFTGSRLKYRIAVEIHREVLELAPGVSIGINGKHCGVDQRDRHLHKEIAVTFERFHKRVISGLLSGSRGDSLVVDAPGTDDYVGPANSLSPVRRSRFLYRW
jgi:hypothetical protein